MTEKKIALYTNSAKINSHLETANRMKDLLQNLYNEGRKANLEISETNLGDALNDTANFAKAQWRALVPKKDIAPSGPFATAPTDPLAGLTLPSLIQFNDVVRAIHGQLHKDKRDAMPDVLPMLRINKGEVIIDDKSIEYLTESNTRYAKSDAELEDWQIHSKVADEVNKLLEYYEAKGQQPYLTPEWLQSKLNLKTVDGKNRFTVSIQSYENRAAGLPEGGGVPIPPANPTPVGMPVRAIHSSALGEANNTIKAGQPRREVAPAARA